MGEQHHVNVTEPWIVAAGYVLRRLVEKADAGRILENDRAVVRAQLAWVRAYRCNLDVLCKRRECGNRKGECCAGDPHVVPPEKFDSCLACRRRASHPPGERVSGAADIGRKRR